MTRNTRGALLVGLVAGMLPAFDVAAQDLSWSFAGEAAGDKTYVVFGQPTLLFGPSTGWRPFVHVGGHVVWTDSPTGTKNAWGITPAAGLRWQDSGGFLEGSVGWAIASEDVDRGFDVFGGGKSGLHTGVHTEYWGSGNWALQGIANYNWGADFLWSRAQILKRVATRSGGGGVSLGARLTWEAQADSDIPSANRFQGTLVGPVLQVSGPSGMNWGVSAGYKHTRPKSTSVDNDTWYAQVDLYLP